MLIQYTSYAEVRAALGVSVEELEDDTLGLPIYEEHLVADLEDIGLTLISTFATTNALSSPTEAQSRFIAAVHVFSTYSVAKHLTGALPLFSPRSVGDGKATVERFNDPYKTTIAKVEAEYERWRNRLTAAFTAVGQASTASTTRTFFAAAAAGANPITGE